MTCRYGKYGKRIERREKLLAERVARRRRRRGILGLLLR
jgi:hypothetical protein